MSATSPVVTTGERLTLLMQTIMRLVLIAVTSSNLPTETPSTSQSTMVVKTMVTFPFNTKCNIAKVSSNNVIHVFMYTIVRIYS